LRLAPISIATGANLKSILAYAAVLTVTISLAGCMTDGDKFDRDAGQQQTEPIMTNNPSPTMDPSRNGSSLNGTADPDVGIESPNGLPGNAGGR
jgi:hypothetical protein